ncbi:hypothetical protein KCM76_25250 [Zooshikella marina]|uniref:hypothetical protein n=1 Tax=Zooshikella ganghwensis TaxID=202772 RepID=UPI001BB0D4A5|nr:hypothetical protein [Zooshikella ganghwensis]MBU2709327.1 hypothetical protein [Zooshikella ganghwensis]
MSKIEHAFEKLLLRQPSEKEIKRLYRIKDTLNLSDNDALWEILIALESYETLYRRIPTQISSHTSKVLNDINETVQLVAEAETKKALNSLTSAVTQTSNNLADKLTDAKRWQIWGVTSIGITLFGALCIFIGYVLGSGKLPFWALKTPSESFLSTIFYSLANTPAGWIIAVSGAGASIISAYKVKDEIKNGKKLGILFTSASLLVVSAIFLWPFF